MVVVAYHGPERLEMCLAAVGRAFPITVVDNSSSAEIESVAVRHGATYVDAGENRGFAAGVNVALRRLPRTEIPDVLLLNPDSVVPHSVVHALARYLKRPGNGRVAAVTPRLLAPNGTEQRVLWPFPTPLRACVEAVGLGRRLSADEMFAVGAVLLLRGEALDDVGLFDERFFLYAEETDWQRRAHERGWRSVVNAETIAHHVGAGTSADHGRREALFHAAQETYIRKWNGRAGWALYRVAACVGAGIRAIVLTGERRRDAARRALLYLRGPCHCVIRGSG